MLYGLLLTALGGACSTDGDPAPVDDRPDTSSETSDDADVSTRRPVAAAPAVCGATSYVWLGTDGMGEVLESEQTHDHGLASLEGLLAFVEAYAGLTLQARPRYAAQVHRMRYRTQNRGEAVGATGLVAYPPGADVETAPFVLVLHGTTGMVDACSPSRSDNDDFLLMSTMAAYLASLGYVAVAPDYLGLKSMGEPSAELHPMMVGEATSIASLDMVRAAERFLAARSDAPATVSRLAVIGGSQGGHAAAFVDHYAPHYAPEYEQVGSVWSTPALNLVEEVRIGLSSSVPATRNSAAMLLTLDSWYSPARGI